MSETTPTSTVSSEAPTPPANDKWQSFNAAVRDFALECGTDRAAIAAKEFMKLVQAEFLAREIEDAGYDIGAVASAQMELSRSILQMGGMSNISIAQTFSVIESSIEELAVEAGLLLPEDLPDPLQDDSWKKPEEPGLVGGVTRASWISVADQIWGLLKDRPYQEGCRIKKRLQDLESGISTLDDLHAAAVSENGSANEDDETDVMGLIAMARARAEKEQPK